MFALTLLAVAGYPHCANTHDFYAANVVTWRNDFGSNVTFISTGRTLYGYYSPRNAADTGSVSHFSLVGWIVPHNASYSILSWTVSWQNADGITTWIGYISGELLYTNSTLVLENYTYTGLDNYRLLV